MTGNPRMDRVRALVVAARRVASERARLIRAIAAHTGLSPEGVELGFAWHLELDATEEELAQLVLATEEASRVHVVLSANVFVAPLRALAVALAASTRVTVRPSRRDPTFARALVAAMADPALTLEESLDVAVVPEGEIHVYGRDQTIAAVRARAAKGVVVRGHGAGMGVALVSGEPSVAGAAEAIARDVIAFDQRGCLSPRVVVCEGDPRRAEAIAAALDDALSVLAQAVPRGSLSEEEAAETVRYVEAMAFAGRVWRAPDHLVALATPDAPVVVPPSGRHVHVAPIASADDAARLLATHARFIVAVGTDAPARYAGVIPRFARVSPLGEMQCPPLDGPVDRRPQQR